jgi:multidrug resistance efflux pump
MKQTFLLGILFFQLTTLGAEIQIRTIDATQNEIAACIAEAKADQEYYQARLQGAFVLLEKAKGLVALREVQTTRSRSLAAKNAVPKEQLEIDEAQLEEAKLNVTLAQAIIGERGAEVRASEARYAQANEGRCIRLPSH